MKNKKLTVTVGLPRSGKSTWAMEQKIPVVNPDSIRIAIHGQAYVEEFEPLVWATAHIMVYSLFIAGHNHVILDATNTTESARNKWKSEKWETRFKLFDTPKNVCIQRAIDGDKKYLIPVIEKMSAQLKNEFCHWIKKEMDKQGESSE